jgi:hypothetical protein
MGLIFVALSAISANAADNSSQPAVAPTEAEVRAAMAQREREYRELFARLDKERNKIARALKEYFDPGTSEKEKVKLRTYLRQTAVKDPEDKKLLKGASLDPQYAELVGDLQLALLHAIQDRPEESDKDYILDLIRRDIPPGWLLYAMLNVWDDRYVPYLIASAEIGSWSSIEILGSAKTSGHDKVMTAIPTLERLLKHPRGEVRQAAYDALTILTGKKYEFPW